MTSSEKGVLHALVLRSDENNVCFPSIDMICRDTGIGKTTVVKCIAALAKGGVISLKKRFSKSTVYTISVSPATLVQPVNYCSERTCTISAGEPALVQQVKPKNTIKNTKEEYIETNPLRRLFSSNYKIFKSKETHGDWQQVIDQFGLVECIAASVALLNDVSVKTVYPNTLAAHIASIQASEQSEQKKRDKIQQQIDNRQKDTPPEVDKDKMNKILEESRKQISKGHHE